MFYIYIYMRFVWPTLIKCGVNTKPCNTILNVIFPNLNDSNMLTVETSHVTAAPSAVSIGP
jgi:hypothetical protein